MAVLARLVAPARAPAPREARVTRWGSDRLARGAFSFTAAGASRRDYRALARPLDCGRVLFAGEATSPDHHATVCFLRPDSPSAAA